MNLAPGPPSFPSLDIISGQTSLQNTTPRPNDNSLDGWSLWMAMLSHGIM